MLEELIKLIHNYPNDAELGKKVREWYWNNKTKRESKIDVWYEREHTD